MSYLIYTDLISSLLDPKLVDPGSTLVHMALRVKHMAEFQSSGQTSKSPM